MALLVGIDEAGYGPLLGPLTVSAVGFEMSDDMLGGDHWGILKKAISKEKRNLKGRLLVTDSKKAYNRKAGPVHLRRTVLAALRSLHTPSQITPQNTRELAEVLCPDCALRLDGYDWYGKLNRQELKANGAEIGIGANVLTQSLKENKIKLVMLSSKCLDVGYYNRMVEIVKNKSRVLFTAIAELIQQAFNLAEAGQMLQVVVDRQGGRANYCDPLRRMFPHLELSVIKQDGKTSSYEMVGSGKTMRVHFVVKADTKCMPVCMASMTSKYLREVMMDSINDYFLGHCDKIAPTAGYWKDGLRFVEDLKTHLPGLEYQKEMLVRNR